MELIAVFFIPVSLVIADCNNPPTPIPNASHNLTSLAPYPTGTVAHFECNDGYNPTGTSKNYRCSDSGSWVDGYLVCEERFCTYIPPPENGRIVNEQTRQIGSAIIFQCNTGYTRSGPDQMTCRADSLWSPNTPPTCRINMCPEFGSIQYAETFQDNSYTVRNGYGSIVKVTCNHGYIISGSPNVMCQADGTWGSRPVCQVSTCPPYTGLNSSCIERTQLVLNNNYLLIACKEGDDVSVTRTGPDAVECKNQQWDMSQGTINCFCDCKIEGLDPAWISISNLNGKGFLNYNEALHWNCLNNARKAATSAPVCREQRINVSELCIKPFRTTSVPPITDSDGNTVYPPTTNVMCQADGTWGSRPDCKVSTCPPYTGFNSSCIERTQLVLNNNYLFLVCKEGDDVSVTRTGPDAAECKNQQWDTSQGTINCFCDCKIEGLDPAWMSISNLNGKGFLNYDETLHWNCLNNAKKAATSAPVCREQRINVSELCIKPFRTTEVPPITDSDGSTVYPPTTKPEKQETGSDTWIKIGLGVGIPVFVILVAVIGIVYWKKHHNTNNSSSGDKFNPEYKNGRHGDGSPHEPEKVDLLNKPT